MIDDDDAALEEEELIGDADLDAGGEAEHEEEAREQIEGAEEGRAKIEADARALGWKPKKEWRGDQSGWVDAEDFLDQVKPARLRDTLHRTSRELADLKRQRETERRDFEDRLARLDKMNTKALARQRDQLLGQLKAAQRQAAEAGDVEAFDHYADQESKAQQHFAKEDEELAKEAPAKQTQQQGQPDPAIAAWVDRNPAVRFSAPKWQAAIGFFSEAEAEDPDGTIADHLAHVEARLNEVWPGTVRAGKAKQNGVTPSRRNGDNGGERRPQTERSGRMAARTPRGKGWADIPADEQKIYRRHIKEGLYKDEAEVAKEHWA